jgi:hypothetical protein
MVAENAECDYIWQPFIIFGVGRGIIKSPLKPFCFSLGMSSSAICHERSKAYSG